MVELHLTFNSLSATRLQASSGKWAGKPGLPEYLFFEVTSPSHPPISAGVVYRPPHVPFTAGEDKHFITDFVDSMHNYCSKVVMGDFNADQLSNSAHALFIKKLISDNALQSVPFGATFQSDDSEMALDLCLVNSEDRIINY